MRSVRAVAAASFWLVGGCVEPTIVDCGTGVHFEVGEASACAYCDGPPPDVCPGTLVRGVGASPFCAPEDTSAARSRAEKACLVRCGSAPPPDGEVHSIATGDDHTCVMIDEDMYCWGANELGQLGIPLEVEGCFRPQRVRTPGRPWVQVGLGVDHTCAQTDDHRLYCFGLNDERQLGRDGSLDVAADPTIETARCDGAGCASFSEPLSSIAGGERFSCVLEGGSSTYCWGRSAPVSESPVPELRGAASVGLVELAAQDRTVCARSATEVRCWGSNDNGEASDGIGAVTPEAPRLVPIEMFDGASAITALGTGSLVSCAIADSQVWCWGSDATGAVGDGGGAGGDIHPTPVRVMGDRRAVAVCVGRAHACALVADTGEVHCWGDGESGQLGHGLLQSSSEPVTVPGLADVRMLSCGADYACAVTADHRILCWGDNEPGLMGDPDDVGYEVPVPTQVFPQLPRR